MSSHYNTDMDPHDRTVCERLLDLEICKFIFEIGRDLKSIHIGKHFMMCFARRCNDLGCSLEGNAVFLNFITYFDLSVYDLNEYALFF